MTSKGFSIIEVLISVTILSSVLIILLDVKGQNLFLVEKMQNMPFLNTMIALTAHSNISSKNKIYIKDIVKTNDDNLRKQLKNISVTRKEDLLNREVVTVNDLEITIKNYETRFHLHGITKIFYSFRLNF